jgi:hypothetical protein
LKLEAQAFPRLSRDRAGASDEKHCSGDMACL